MDTKELRLVFIDLKKATIEFPERFCGNP